MFYLRCSVCGRFIDKPYDEGCNFGSSTDTDPPDPDYFCKKCANGLMRIAEIAPKQIAGEVWWCSPKYVARARKAITNG